MMKEDKEVVEHNDELEIPDFSVGLVMGLKQDGSFFLHQLSAPLDPPLVDALALRGMIEIGLCYMNQLIQDTTMIGSSSRALQLLKTMGPMAQLTTSIAKDFNGFRELIARSQHANAELLQLIQKQALSADIQTDSPQTDNNTEDNTDNNTDKE